MGNEGSKGKSKSGTTIQGTLNGIRGGPSSSTVTKHMEMAQKTRVLQLKNSGIKKFPENAAELVDILRNIELSQNKLTMLPPFIGDFSQLKQLHLSDNCLESLPEEIGQLNSLEVLNLANNRLTVLPSSFPNLESLRNLDLEGNSFQQFPLSLVKLGDLDLLNLAQNGITEIPDEIASLNVSELNMNRNRLSRISPQIGYCPRLKVLRVEENCLEKTAFTKQILEDSTINIISYAGNLFQDKDFQYLPGYDAYQLRYTATRRKI
ncbi:unnamed protein product, partial [Mesorhabditis spiculigera]